MAAIPALVMLLLAVLTFRWSYIRMSRRMDMDVRDAF